MRKKIDSSTESIRVAKMREEQARKAMIHQPMGGLEGGDIKIWRSSCVLVTHQVFWDGVSDSSSYFVSLRKDLISAPILCRTPTIMEFLRKLSPVHDNLNLDEISIRMSNRTWTIRCNNMSLNYPIFLEFIEALWLEWTDYLCCNSGNHKGRVVFDAIKDSERMFECL